jgi:hypothetical protein
MEWPENRNNHEFNRAKGSAQKMNDSLAGAEAPALCYLTFLLTIGLLKQYRLGKRHTEINQKG